MRKNTITEPKFGKIFAVRFFVSLLIFSSLAAYCLYKLDDYVWNKVDTERSQCLKKIEEVTQKLSKDKPGSEQYERYMGLLKIYMVMIGAGIIIPSISLPIWGFAICVLAWGLKDYIPYPDCYDSDYVDRYFKAQEDARLYTRAMIHQAHLHSGELKILNEKINGKK